MVQSGAIKFTDQTLKYITLFEGLTKTKVKDCIEILDILYFIVDAGQLKKALDRNGSNIKKLRKLMKKNIKLIEYSPDIKTFIKNIFYEFPIKDINIKDNKEKKHKIAYVSVELRDKGKIIGRESRNLKIAKEILNRYATMDIIIN